MRTDGTALPTKKGGPKTKKFSENVWAARSRCSTWCVAVCGIGTVSAGRFAENTTEQPLGWRGRFR